MKSRRALRIAILCYIHYKGWCTSLHKRREYVGADPSESWRTGCPIVDRIIMDLWPPLVWKGSSEAFREAAKMGVTPGRIFRDRQEMRKTKP